jgi:MobA/MobL family
MPGAASVVRTFELSTRIKAVQRSKGDSATAKAAYRACCIIECEREGRTHDYSRKHGLEASEIVLPESAPAWARDRVKLWNAAENRERNGSRGKNAGTYKPKAQTARDLMFTFPAELSPQGRLKAARTVARHLVTKSGVAVDFNIHEPGRDGDEKNHHCHMMFTTRRMTANGLGEKSREWDERKDVKLTEAKKLRAFIAQTLNAELKAEGKAHLARVEHESFKERGVGRKPTVHQGPSKTHMLKKRQRELRHAWEQTQRRDQRERHARERASLKLRQDFALQNKLAELEQRGREGRGAIRRDFAQAAKADIPPRGLRRAFLTATGQHVREDFNRQARATQRTAGAEQQKTDLKATLKAERNAFVKSQLDDRQRLDDRHKAEDRQLEQAFEHRKSLDRAAEVQARSNDTRSHSREQQNEREHGRGRSISGDEIMPP